MSIKPIKIGFNKFIHLCAEELYQGRSPLEICEELLSGNRQLPEFMASADIEERYYWLGNIYTSLIPTVKKSDLAAYFTPPHIARYTISRAEELGLNLARSRILDPASGGAAFLTPLSTSLIEKLRAQGKTDAEIGLHISRHLSGIELDGNLARLSVLIFNDFLSKRLSTFNKDLSALILNEDSLRLRERSGEYDAVVSNPPYGRMLNPPGYILERFADSLTDKHVNKYALFIRLSIDWVRPGGFIALVVPTSFIAGPSFRNLRKSILVDAHVLAIDLIDKRDGLFVDVLQDACILFLRKKNGQESVTSATCRFLHEDGPCRDLGFIDIPSTPSIRPWVLPSEFSPDIPTSDFFSGVYANLADYGYGARAGYFVWNRQKERCREKKRPGEKEFPLIWAHCVKSNEPCRLSTHRIHGQPDLMTFVKFDAPSESLISQPAVVLQRTTNRRQAKRLIAGYIPKSMIDEYGSLISENHTIVVYPLPSVEQHINCETMCRLLNSRPVDNRYRQISGTVSISVKLMKEMPFPPPILIQNKLRNNLSEEEFDALVEDCYREAARLSDDHLRAAGSLSIQTHMGS
ncbi:N-6 DNA methylase [Desulfuromonas sp. CSMB_57]|uniref:HsdM family class I SAM-dependent methyltransferase n=1 Tax=Desulfuromonas sp. CSMB_57 TaxID=2807629 RepID=UPI001CD2D785|nr:N-6 DNA methylase [Desulfuromonas sp. CSMB_57]